MNNFAEIVLIERFKKVNYYSLSINGEQSLFSKFITKHTIENKEKLAHILKWISVIGDKIGSKEFYFRNESETASTSALPPRIGLIKDEPMYIETDEDGISQTVPNNLRLYCMRLSDNVVFLFDGDIKTARVAQECSNVKPYFRQANLLTKLIDQAIIDGDIQWNPDHTDIVFEDDFCLIW